jgi:hypothetical protein
MHRIGAAHDARPSRRRARLSVPGGTAFNVDGEVLSAGPVDLGVRARAFSLVVG